jgi:hypothetical protein
MSAAMGGFNDLLAVGQGPAARLARHALGVVNRMGPAKRLLAARAMGLAGELPAAARRA